MLQRFTSPLRLSLTALAVVCALSAFGVTSAFAATSAVSPFGMCSHLLWGYENTEIDHELDLMKAAGTSWVRIDVSWRDIETSDNTYNASVLKALDHVVAAAASRNMSVVPVIMEFPDWANGSKGIWAPPTNDATFQDFTRYMAARYAGKIMYWELGNEVNEAEFWGVARSASPARYTQFLQKGYAGVKQGSPDALVISAGLAGSDDGYLQEMYDAGAKGYFDILGVHAYTRGRSPYAQDLNTPSSTFDGLAIMKTTMENNGDATKKIWVTEAGWQTSNVNYHVTEAQQAQYTYEAFERLHDSFPYVETLFTYGLRNNGTDLSVSTDNYGLMSRTYVAKPAYAAYRHAFDAFGQATPTPTPTPTPTATPTPTPPATDAPVETVTPPATDTPAETATPTATETPAPAPTETIPGVTPAVTTPTVTPAVPVTTPRPTIKTSKKTVHRRHSVVVSGTAIRAASSVMSVASGSSSSRRINAKLQSKIHGHWRTVRTLTTNSAGHYRARIRFAKTGIFRYRLVLSRTSVARGASSRVISVRVR